MNGIPMELGLSLSAVLFVLGLIGVLVRRNLIMMLIMSRHRKSCGA